MVARPPSELTRSTLAVLFIGLLIASSLWILRPFLFSLAWAVMIVVASWSLFWSSFFAIVMIMERTGGVELMRRIDELCIEHPWMGSRTFVDHLTAPEFPVGRDRVRRLMRVMGIESLAPKPGASKRQPKHPVYPYLLRGMAIDKPGQVRATDITYIPMTRGFMYLISIMDWAARKVLSWRLSNTLDTRFRVEALKEALFKYGAPEIFNTDQGCQFTSKAFTSVLKTWNVKISMDGKGRFKDNIFIERLWRTLKYERIYLKSYETGTELSRDLTFWFNWYNKKRKHSSLDKQTPNEAYAKGLELLSKAA